MENEKSQRIKQLAGHDVHGPDSNIETTTILQPIQWMSIKWLRAKVNQNMSNNKSGNFWAITAQEDDHTSTSVPHGTHLPVVCRTDLVLCYLMTGDLKHTGMNQQQRTKILGSLQTTG